MDFNVIFNQVGVLAAVMLLGFVAVKAGYVKAEIKDSISTIIIKILLPCLIISSISSKEINSDFLGDMAIVAGMSLFSIAILFLIGTLTAKIFKIPNKTSTLHKLLFSVGNVMFIGYPIITSAYGEDSFIYLMVYWLFNDFFVWTLGIYMLTKNNQQSGNPLKKLLNPNTISFAAAIIMMIFGIKLPPIIDSAVYNTGQLTTYLSMIFIGMALATVDVKRVVRKWWVFIIVVFKLIIMPVVFILIFNALGIKELIYGVVVLAAAMPAQTVTTMLANEYKSDVEYGAVTLFVTTILSLGTLPLVCWFIDRIA